MQNIKRSAEKCLFREDFINSDFVRDNQGTLVASPTVANGLVLNGSSQYATYTTQRMNLTNKTLFTMEAWFTPTFAGDDGVNHTIFDTINTAGQRMNLQKNDSSLLLVYVGGTLLSTINFATYGAYWLTNKKNHLVACCQTGSTLVYLNNTLVGTLANAWTQTGTPAALYIGKHISSAIYFAGTIHSVSIYDTKWSAGEVANAFKKNTFSEIAFEKASLYLPCKSQYSPDATNYYTENKGTGADVVCGSAGSYRPTQAQYNGFVYDNADSYLDAGSGIVVPGATTFAGILNPTGYGEGNLGVIFSDGKCIVRLYLNNQNIYLYSNGATAAASATNSIPLGCYTSFVITRTALGVANFYINGELNGTANQASGTPEAGTTNLIVGNNSGRTATFNGTIKFPLILNGITATPTQVRAIHNQLMQQLNQG